MNKIKFSKQAKSDLQSIQLHYLIYASERSVEKHLKEIQKGIEMIALMPALGAPVEDSKLRIGPGYRRYLASDFWIYYSVSTNDEITIWRIFHSKQNIDTYAFTDFYEVDS